MIDFSAARWEKTVKNFDDFWNKKLNRPLVSVRRSKEADEDKRGRAPDTPLLMQATCHLDLPAAKWLDAYDYHLSGLTFMGDTYPSIGLDEFGPGVAAAFMGAELDNSTGLVWFRPKKAVPVTELHFEYDPNNKWYVKIMDIMTEATRRWQGEVMVGMPDFGGVMDILSTFLPGEELLIALYDEPGEVARCVKEIQALWFRYYDELAAVIAPATQGYSNWADLLVPGADSGGYIYQCDFAYMIGPDMFRDFILDSLAADFARTKCNAYHLDGVGQLPHLDMLLELPDLDLVQWVPGSGAAPEHTWGAVHTRILKAGKHLQLHSGNTQEMRGLLSEIKGDMSCAANAHIRIRGGDNSAETQAFIDELYGLYE